MAGKVQWHPAQAPGTFLLAGSHHLLATRPSSPTTGLDPATRQCEVVTRHGTLRKGRIWGMRTLRWVPPCYLNTMVFRVYVLVCPVSLRAWEVLRTRAAPQPQTWKLPEASTHVPGDRGWVSIVRPKWGANTKNLAQRG